MFGFFRKKRFKPVDDIEDTLFKTFEYLKEASLQNDLLIRGTEMMSRLSACSGALKKVHNFPIDDSSPSMNLLMAWKNGDLPAIEREDREIMSAIRSLPDSRDAKVMFVLYMISPSLVESNQT